MASLSGPTRTTHSATAGSAARASAARSAGGADATSTPLVGEKYGIA